MKLPKNVLWIWAIGANAIALILALSLKLTTATNWIERSGFWTLTVAFFGLLLCAGKAASEWGLNWRSNRREWLLAGILILTASTYTGFRETPSWRVMGDDSVIAATGMRMGLSQRQAVPFIVFPSEETHSGFKVAESFVDKRPGTVPYLTGLVTMALGRRPTANVIANLCLIPVLFTGLYLLGRKIHPLGGALSVLLLGSLNLSTYALNSGGLETAYLTFIIITTLWMMRLFERKDALSLTGCVFAFALYANTRYEALLLAPLTLGLFIFAYREKLKADGPPLATGLIGFLLLNAILSKEALKVHLTGYTDVFGLQHIGPNLRTLATWLFVPSGEWPGSPGLTILGVAGLIAVARWLTKNYKSPRVPAWAFITCGLLVTQVVLLPYFWATNTDPAVWRLNLPLTLVLVLGATALLAFLQETKLAVVVFAACLGLVTLPQMFAPRAFMARGNDGAIALRQLALAKAYMKGKTAAMLTSDNQTYSTEALGSFNLGDMAKNPGLVKNLVASGKMELLIPMWQKPTGNGTLKTIQHNDRGKAGSIPDLPTKIVIVASEKQRDGSVVSIARIVDVELKTP